MTETPRHFLSLFDFFDGFSSSSAGALLLPDRRVLLRVPSVGGFFAFFGALGLLSLLFPAAFLPLFALGLSSLASLLPDSLVSVAFLSSDLGLGAPFEGSFLEPGSFSYPPPESHLRTDHRMNPRDRLPLFSYS